MKPQTEWINKTEAAAQLKISERTVLQLASSGKIISKKERNPGSNQTAVQFNAADVERYGFERDNPKEKPIMQASQSLQTIPASIAVPLEIGILQKMLNPPEATHYQAWMTVKECEKYSGLPASTLMVFIKSKRLPAIDCGPRAGGRWRVSRRDMDKLEGGWGQ